MWRRSRDRRGTVSVITALAGVVLLGSAAIAIDIGMLAVERQKLRDNLDFAAHAGAYYLPGDGDAAVAEARRVALENDPSLDPTTKLYCVVGSTPGRLPKSEQIPNTCDPGLGEPYTGTKYPGMYCDRKYCYIPCDPSVGKCNTLRVEDTKVVPFAFAPVFGINEGVTGGVSSAACKGSCGDEAPNAMDVVVMADRTRSMEEPDRAAMKLGIQEMLKTMDPKLQYVAFGALHKSEPYRSGSDGNGGSTDPRCVMNASGYSRYSSASTNAQRGTWIPVPFSNDYQGSTPLTLNPGSELVKAVGCLPASSGGAGAEWAYGTQLASGMKAAARYVLGIDSNNLGSLPARPTPAKKVIIFETDGQPDETWDGGSSTLTTSGDVAYGRQGDSSLNGIQGCQGFKAAADQAKSRGALVITIGFGDASTADCRKGGSTSHKVRNYLAGAASAMPDGTASAADKSCTKPSADEPAPENADGDFYFCATQGAELSDIFASAIEQVSTGIRFVPIKSVG